jgi:CRP/FNR family transcriptional regulator, cyclic AMP receptor protein
VSKTESITQFIEESRLFKGAPQGAIKMATEAATIRQFPEDGAIFRENDPGEAVYLLTKGRVKIARANLEGRERIFTIMTPPEVIGEMALISQNPRTATAYCLDDVTALAIYRDELRSILERYPLVLWNLANIMAGRLGDMNREVEMLSFASTQACVAYALQSLYLRGAFIAGAEGRPTLGFTHQDLANRTGNSRETITRVLRDLENEGIIKTRPGQITLLRPEALEDIIFGLRDEDE